MNREVGIITVKQNQSVVNLRLGGAIMATKAQIAANRRNCQKSTGPTTPQGKAAVAKNPIKHGLFARQALIDTEDHAEFDLYRDRMLEDLAPVGPLESALAERIVTLYWRLRRAACIQNQTIDALTRPKAPTPLQKSLQALLPKGYPAFQPDPADADPQIALGRMAIKDFSNERVLHRLLLYERRIESSLYTTLLELQRLRLIRKFNLKTKPDAQKNPKTLLTARAS